MTHDAGEAIGPYEVVRPLGSSGAAPTAWLARRRSDPSDLVVVRRQVRQPGPGDHQADGDRADGPRQPATSRRHPNVVRLLDALHNGSEVTLVTEFAAGGSLRRRLEAGPLDVGETITVMAGVASALADWHAHAEVHGTLHPGRVLFHSDGRPVVDASGARPATVPGYASPEVARGHRPEPSDDVFALASLALCCLAGKPAWPADELRDVVIQSVFGQWPVAPAGIPVALADLLTQMLDRDPALRPAASEVFRALSGCGQPIPVRLVPVPTSELPAERTDQAEAMPTAAAVEPVARGESTPADLQPEWLTDSGSVAEWLRATVRRPVAAPAEELEDEAAQAQGPARPGWAPRFYGRPAVRTMAAVAAALCVLVGVWFAGRGGESGPGSGDSAASIATAPPVADTGEFRPSIDWLQVLSRLDALRAQAFQTADVNLLAEVYAPESAAFHTDARRISELAAAGYQVPLISHEIRSATQLTVDGTGSSASGIDGDPPVTLTVEQAMPAFEIHDSTGVLVGRTIQQPPSRSTVTLVQHGDSYRILSVADVP
jgi:eukaryotic-like serine/threonine-protein kinase